MLNLTVHNIFYSSVPFIFVFEHFQPRVMITTFYRLFLFVFPSLVFTFIILQIIRIVFSDRHFFIFTVLFLASRIFNFLKFSIILPIFFSFFLDHLFVFIHWPYFHNYLSSSLIINSFLTSIFTDILNIT